MSKQRQPTELNKELKINCNIKKQFSDSLNYCLNRLKFNNYYDDSDGKNGTISWRSKEIAEEIYQYLLNVLKKMPASDVVDSAENSCTKDVDTKKLSTICFNCSQTASVSMSDSGIKVHLAPNNNNNVPMSDYAYLITVKDGMIGCPVDNDKIPELNSEIVNNTMKIIFDDKLSSVPDGDESFVTNEETIVDRTELKASNEQKIIDNKILINDRKITHQLPRVYVEDCVKNKEINSKYLIKKNPIIPDKNKTPVLNIVKQKDENLGNNTFVYNSFPFLRVQDDDKIEEFDPVDYLEEEMRTDDDDDVLMGNDESLNNGDDGTDLYSSQNDETYFQNMLSKLRYPNSTWAHENFEENSSSFDSTGVFEYCLETDNETNNFDDVNNNFEDDDENDDGFDDNDGYYNLKSTSKTFKQYVRLDQKINIISTASLHPNWSIEEIRRHTRCEFVESRYQISKWTCQIRKGPSRADEMKAVNRWVFAKCLAHQKKNQHLKSPLSNEMITKWGLEAKDELVVNYSNCFNAGSRWLTQFKKAHHIYGKSPRLYIKRIGKSKSKSRCPSIVDNNYSSAENKSLSLLNEKNYNTHYECVEEMMNETRKEVYDESTGEDLKGRYSLKRKNILISDDTTVVGKQVLKIVDSDNGQVKWRLTL